MGGGIGPAVVGMVKARESCPLARIQQSGQGVDFGLRLGSGGGDPQQGRRRKGGLMGQNARTPGRVRPSVV